MSEQKLQTVSLKQLNSEEKVLLLRELGYQSDGSVVLDSNGEVVIDKYIGEPVHIERMLILPGSEIILDDNEISITMYLEEYGDRF